ncbi:TetR/AcrR family transcriptional regulator [Paractinoplanes lichenicola]|uniref:TetR/AcrR family transcriptional regulator n=1 Tax=Paractinoplanes lichenicola TaxID=2802976 RepID=A0ABS1W596_9ACTN|nr:TetR/AcrR family transcriptional regulator [Actinoplanes lichenicola]MBL7261921.1 TetR/AcrR family transcriptional regulator [Actinoplanes lichenicola]
MTREARRTRAQGQEQTHQRLLAAGREVFLRRGFLEATVDDLAAEAGYTRGAVYKHFGGKEGLWHALVDASSAAVTGALTEAVGGARDREELVAALNPGRALEDPDAARWALVSAEAAAALAGRPEHAGRLATAQAALDRELAGLLTEACERLGLRPAVPVPQLVTAWGALGAGLVLRHAADGRTDVTGIATGILGALLGQPATRGG